MIASIRTLSLTALAVLSLAACQADGGQSPSPPARAPVAEGGLCGGFAGFQCQAGLYCQMTPEMQHVADGSGTCRKRPQMCTREYRPV
ncbi:MAG TPA: Kazal domain-containing protein, partial [Caulobacter sp.]|nr:Kazal domain-containing protein [Caulobacter sp.]